MPDRDSDDKTIEQLVAWARNSDNIMDTIYGLESLEKHSLSARAFRELATPLILSLREEATAALQALNAGDRAKGRPAKAIRALKKKAAKRAASG